MAYRQLGLLDPRGGSLFRVNEQDKLSSDKVGWPPSHPHPPPKINEVSSPDEVSPCKVQNNWKELQQLLLCRQAPLTVCPYI